MTSQEGVDFISTNTTSLTRTPKPIYSTDQMPPESSALGLINYETRQMIEIVLFSIVIAVIGVLGMISNIINSVIFYKHGFHDTVNISLFALAVSDFFTLLTLEWISLCLNPLFSNSGIPWNTRHVMYLTGAWPNLCFGRISCWVTTYITAERCLCIALPMTVKRIITPQRTIIIMGVTYFANLLIAIPTYMASYFDWTFVPEQNVTIITLVFRENGPLLDAIGFVILAAAGAIPFPPVMIFTAILVVRLKRQSDWRMKTSHDKQQEMTSKRDSKTMNMLVMVACILIVCYTPGIVSSAATFIAPSFSFSGVNVNLFYVVWCFNSLFQVVNASVNILVYYKMSTKYRKTFRRYVCRIAENQNEN